MKPLLHLIIIIFTGIAYTLVTNLIVDRKIYDISFMLGMALVYISPALIIYLIGYIFKYFDRPIWSLIIKLSWTFFIVFCLLSFLGTTVI
jgi:hypothetical protein